MYMSRISPYKQWLESIWHWLQYTPTPPRSTYWVSKNITMHDNNFGKSWPTSSGLYAWVESTWPAVGSYILSIGVVNKTQCFMTLMDLTKCEACFWRFWRICCALESLGCLARSDLAIFVLTTDKTDSLPLVHPCMLQSGLAVWDYHTYVGTVV